MSELDDAIDVLQQVRKRMERMMLETKPDANDYKMAEAIALLVSVLETERTRRDDVEGQK